MAAYEYKVGQYTVYLINTVVHGWFVYDSLERGADPIMTGFKTRKAALAAAERELGG